MVWAAIGVGVASAVGGAVTSINGQRKAAEVANENNAPYQQLIAQGEALSQQPFQQYGGEFVAPETGNEIAASTIAPQLRGQEQGFLGEAAQQYQGDTISRYMNPYVQQAINVPEQQLALNYGQQQAELARKSNMTDAFGVGRSAALSGQLNRNYETEFGNIQAQGMSQAFQNAQTAFQNDTARYSRLANQVGALGSQDINALLTTGQNERSIAQAKDTANYNEFMRGQNWATNQFSAAVSAINGAKGGRVVAQPADTLSGLIGGAASALGAFGKGFGGGGGGGSSGYLGGAPDATAIDISGDTGNPGGIFSGDGSGWGNGAALGGGAVGSDFGGNSAGFDFTGGMGGASTPTVEEAPLVLSGGQ